MAKIVWEPGDIFETMTSNWGMVIDEESSIIFTPPTVRSWKASINVFMSKAIPKGALPVKRVGSWAVVMCIKTAGVLLGIDVDWVELLKV